MSEEHLVELPPLCELTQMVTGLSLFVMAAMQFIGIGQ